MDSANALKEQYRDSGNFVQRLTLHRRFGTNRYGWYRWVFEQLELGRDPKILELGCGPGALWKRTLEYTPASTFIVLSDFSAGMLGDCAHNLGTHAGRVRFCQLDARCLPFRDHSFDTIVANMMLYHVADRANAIRDIRRVLGGGAAFMRRRSGIVTCARSTKQHGASWTYHHGRPRQSVLDWRAATSNFARPSRRLRPDVMTVRCV